MKNITLSADENLIAKARIYAKEHDTTLNQLIRDYLFKLVTTKDATELAEEFDKLVELNAGYPEADWHFNREEIYIQDSQRG